MSLFSRLSKKYIIHVVCDNCNKKVSVGIPKATSVYQAMEGNLITCDYCGCDIEVEEYETEWSKK